MYNAIGVLVFIQIRMNIKVATKVTFHASIVCIDLYSNRYFR